MLNSDNHQADFEPKTIHSILWGYLPELDVELVIHQSR